MGKRAKDDAATGTAGAPIEISAGPLARWRLLLCVGVAGATTGSVLVRAAETGVGLDMALGRSFGIAFLIWIALGKINRVLVQASADKAVTERFTAQREPTARLTAVPDRRTDSTTVTPAASTDHDDASRAA